EAFTRGRRRRAKSTRSAGSTASTAAARGISSSGSAPSRATLPRLSKSIHGKVIPGAARSLAGRKMRSFIGGSVARAAPDDEGARARLRLALHQRLDRELHVV